MWASFSDAVVVKPNCNNNRPKSHDRNTLWLRGNCILPTSSVRSSELLLRSRAPAKSLVQRVRTSGPIAWRLGSVQADKLPLGAPRWWQSKRQRPSLLFTEYHSSHAIGHVDLDCYEFQYIISAHPPPLDSTPVGLPEYYSFLL